METKNELTADLEALAGLEKIRNILFGESMRRVDERLRELDAESARALQMMREDILQRFETLERNLEQHVAALGRRLDAHEADKLGREELGDLLRSLAQRVEQRPEGDGAQQPDR